MESKVLLVYPPPQLRSDELRRTDGSLGLTYLAGALERENIGVDILDASVGMEGDDLGEVFTRSVDQPNDLLGPFLH